MNVEKPPSKEEVQTFWTSIWGTEKDYNEEDEWLKREEKLCEGLEEQVWDEIKVEKVKEAIRKLKKWKFWLNNFDSIHKNMNNCFNRSIANPETNPQWFTQGITYQLSKSSETNIPKNYGLSTCLSPAYNLLDANKT